jgi:hypothetical protein
MVYAIARAKPYQLYGKQRHGADVNYPYNLNAELNQWALCINHYSKLNYLLKTKRKKAKRDDAEAKKPLPLLFLLRSICNFLAARQAHEINKLYNY